MDSLIIKKCIVGTLSLGLSTGRSTTPSDCIFNDVDCASGMELEVSAII